MISTTWRRRIAATGLAAALLSAAACSEDSNGSSSGGGDGVEYGATKADYTKALAEIDPIKLTVQTPGPKGSLLGLKEEDYYAAVEDWSDGKISFDINYSNAISPPVEVDEAIADGRLDMSVFVPTYQPDKYPVTNELGATFPLSPTGAVVHPLQSHAFLSDVGLNTPEVLDEFDKQGLHVLLPFNHVGTLFMLCTKESTGLADVKGKVIATSSKRSAAEFEGLGMSPTSLQFTEFYEALTRGTIDCYGAALPTATAGGLVDVAPYAMYPTSTNLSYGAGNFLVNKSVWEGLPLVVQQLMYDRLDVFLTSTVRDIWKSSAETIAAFQKAGGGAFPLDDAADAKVAAVNDSLMDEFRKTKVVDDADALANRVEDAVDKWNKIITDDLKFDDSVGYDGIGDWLKSGPPDLKPYIDRLFKDVFLPHRPGK